MIQFAIVRGVNVVHLDSDILKESYDIIVVNFCALPTEPPRQLSSRSQILGKRKLIAKFWTTALPSCHVYIGT